MCQMTLRNVVMQCVAYNTQIGQKLILVSLNVWNSC